MSVVVASNYSTAGNNSRKLVLLSNGWLVSSVHDSSGGLLKFYVSKDNGATWSQLTFCSLNPNSGYAMASKGTDVYVISTNTVTLGPFFYKFNATTVPNTDRNVGTPVAIDSLQTTIGTCSLNVDSSGIIHAAWLTKNASYPNSFNIRYSKSTNGGETWLTPTQVSTKDTAGDNFSSLCIVTNHYNQPIILSQRYDGTTYSIFSNAYSGSEWSSANSGGGSLVYSSSYPCGSVCALTRKHGSSIGSICATWHGQDAMYAARQNIYFSMSYNAGVTWSGLDKITTGNAVDRKNPVLSEDHLGNVYVIYDDNGSIAYQKRGNYSGEYTDFTVLSATGNDPASTDYDSAFMGCAWMGAGTVQFDKFIAYDPPLAPTGLICPNFDATLNQVMTWTFNPSGLEDTQTAYRVVINRVSDGVQVMETGKMYGTDSTYTLPANTCVNGVQYQWKVLCWGKAVVSGQFSFLSTFYTASPPAVTITSPISDATLTESSVAVTWSYSDLGGNAQGYYRVQLTSTADSVLWDSGKIMDSAARSKAIPYKLDNLSGYKVKVLAWNSKGIQSTYATKSFSIIFTTPAQPSVVVIPSSGYAIVKIINPTAVDQQPIVRVNSLHRREAGEESWERIAANLIASEDYFCFAAPSFPVLAGKVCNYNDYAVASGKIYEYKTTAMGINGAEIDSLTDQGVVAFKGVWIHAPSDPANTIHFFRYSGGKNENWKPEVSMMQFAGRDRPVAEFGEAVNSSMSVKLQMKEKDTEYAKLQSLIRKKETICYRDSRGRKMFGVVLALPTNDVAYGYEVTLEIIENSFSEVV